MKKHFSIFIATFLCLGLTSASAQFGRSPGGPKFDGATAKLFGEHSAFTAALEFQTSQMSGDTTTLPGKIVFDNGKSRFEMNLADAKGMKMPPSAIEHMKAMGMDTMISISRPDQKLVRIVYPGLHSYVEMAVEDPAATNDSSDYKIETTELGKETLDGHDCVKNRVTVTDKEGTKHESLVWNATDLKNFPVKIVTGEPGHEGTMLFKQITFDKPAASSFEAPADFTKYDNMQNMMQTEMMKKMGGMAPPAGR